MNAVLIACGMMGMVLASVATPTNQTAYAMRTTSDMARLDFRIVSDDPHHVWTVVRLTPQERPAANDEPRDTDNPFAGPLPTLPVAGRWSAVAVLQGELDSETGDYAWREPAFRFVTGVAVSTRAALIYDPFQMGGHILCRLDINATGKDTFSQVYLIPDGWAEPLRDAFRRYQELDGSWDDLTQDDLQALIASDNDVLSILAFRHALHRRQLDKSAVAALIEESAGIKKSVLAYVALSASDERPSGSLGIAEIIERTRDIESLERLAIGIASALKLCHTDHVLRQGLWLLLQLKEKAADLGVSIEDNDTFREAYRQLGLASDH